ncbi:Fur family transcriptional regulator [Corynebacterium kroppenstedtii]|uniref:Fur family transcriptional regulator n=1 Tax=Corynebacterium sp. PCR 32 TaxID=3351342 RepID=UPI0030A4E264
MATKPRRKTIGIRSTRQRAAVEDILADLHRFASAGDIHRRIVDTGGSVGLTTVYRTLQALADAGEVDVLNSLGGESLYRKCHSSTHHHHLVCTSCGAAIEIDGGSVEEWSQKAADHHGYIVTGHTAEVFGLCPRCHNNKKS